MLYFFVEDIPLPGFPWFSSILILFYSTYFLSLIHSFPFAFQWFLITLIWFLNVEGNCIEISTSIYSCVHSNTLISKPNIDWRLLVYHLLWPALGGSLNGCVNYQTHWCWLRTAKMPLHHSSGCEHFLWGNVKCRAGPLGDTLTECTFYTNVIIPSHHMIMTIPSTKHISVLL